MRINSFVLIFLKQLKEGEMLEQKQLKARANAIGAGIILLVASSRLLYFFVQLIYSGISKNATLSNPIGINPILHQFIQLIVALVALVIPVLFLNKFCKLPPQKEKLAIDRVDKLDLLMYLGGFVIVATLATLLVNGIDWVIYVKLGFKNSYVTQYPQGFFAMILCMIKMCVIPAIFEESLFRNSIQGSLNFCGERFAVITTSILFALSHPSFSQVVGVFIISMYIGYIAVITKNYLVCVVLHFSYNLLSFVLGVVRNSIDGMSAFGFIIIVFMICFSIAIFSVYRFKTQNIKLKPLSVIPILENNKSRVETMLTAPIFSVCVVTLGFLIVIKLIAG